MTNALKSINEIMDQSADALEQLRNQTEYLTIQVGEHQVELTHLAKPLWSANPEHPREVNVTKRELLSYYMAMAPALLPYLQDRPLTVKRFPEGIDGPSFMQRHVDDLPEFVETVDICTDGDGNNEPFLLCQNTASLLWLVNNDAIEFHPWHSRINPEKTGLPTIFINSARTLEMSVLNYPDWLIFDIDPAATANSDQHNNPDELFDHARQAAQLIHQYLDELQIRHLAKVTGRRGIHIFIPLIRLYSYDQVRQAAKKMSEILTERHDTIFTTEWHIEKRQGKVFLDWQQNARGKSAVAAYSLRATDQATVSAPFPWSALSTIQPQKISLESVTRQLVKLPSHFWDDLHTQAQELPDHLLQ